MHSSFKDYSDTVSYLYGLQRHGIKLGLENPRRLMSILGQPQKSFRSIHIAGTNGKGSTAAIIASILKESGFKTGLYTSPHLLSFTERIRINNIPVSESDVVELVYYIRNTIDAADITPTFFEFVTAMAFYYFAREKVDWAVVEAGMGGRLDATNVILPDVSVITNISLDHKKFLGETMQDIAFEKAGIIKPAVPVVTAVTYPDALKAVEEASKACSSPLHLYNRDFKGILISMDNRHIEFDYSGNLSMNHSENCRGYNNLFLPLCGKHQLYNASLAIRACEILMRKGVGIYESGVYKGLLNLSFEGRLEWISQIPPIIIDSAHNPEAAETLSDTVKEIFPESKKIILIAGIMKDKDIKGILKPLMQISDIVILTKPKGERAAHPEKLEECIRSIEEENNKNFMPGSIVITSTVAEAVELAKTLWNEDYIILVTGSFYTTGEAKEVLGQKGILSGLRE